MSAETFRAELNAAARRATGRTPDAEAEPDEPPPPPPVPMGARGSADLDSRTPSERMNDLIRDELNKPR